MDSSGGNRTEEVKAKARLDFLLAMYKALWDNINRHVTVLWQSVAVLATGFGAALLIKKDAPEAGQAMDIAAALVTAGAAWLVAHALDASGWFNRNVQLIANIEAEFLEERDAQRISPWIGYARANKMLMHMRIQTALGVAIGLATLITHFAVRVWPTLDRHAPFDLGRSSPYIVLILGAIGVGIVGKATWDDHEDLLFRLKKIEEKVGWLPWRSGRPDRFAPVTLQPSTETKPATNERAGNP